MFTTIAATVSVVMPVYNMERFVGQSIRSVLAQTYTDFELIIIDDGGSDRSVEICQSFNDPRIRIVHQANRGLAAARNTGTAKARGRFVAFLDGDDAWLPEKLERHVAHLMANPMIGVSYCASDLIDENGVYMGVRQTPLMGRVSARNVFYGQTVQNGSVPVFRMQALEDAALRPAGSSRVWYFDETLRRSEDVECWARIALKTRWGFEGLPDALTLHRTTRGGLPADIIRQLESWEFVYDKIKAYAPKFIARYGAEARARELRYLAHRGFQTGDRGIAIALIMEALRIWPKLIIREPVKTITTFAACALMQLVPDAPFKLIARAVRAPGYAGAA